MDGSLQGSQKFGAVLAETTVVETDVVTFTVATAITVTIAITVKVAAVLVVTA